MEDLVALQERYIQIISTNDASISNASVCYCVWSPVYKLKNSIPQIKGPLNKKKKKKTSKCFLK